MKAWRWIVVIDFDDGRREFFGFPSQDKATLFTNELKQHDDIQVSMSDRAIEIEVEDQKESIH
jgi:hypothetical protein